MKLLHRLLTDAPMMEDGALHALLFSVFTQANALLTKEGFEFLAAEHPRLKQFRELAKPTMSVNDEGVAVIPVNGMLARKPDVFEQLYGGVEDSTAVLDLVNTAATSPNIRGALLDMDSPGGFVNGGPEIADAVASLAKVKPVVAWTGGSMASLAYYIGSQANQVIASRSAQVGSIGVMAAIKDYSKLFESMGVKVELFKNKEAQFKGVGIPGTSMTDEQRAHIQEGVQASFRDFKRAVKGARPQASDEAMQGQVFTGTEAKKVGLIDRVGDRHFALSVLRSEMRKRS
jgi:signal peptide peptidase SppA